MVINKDIIAKRKELAKDIISLHGILQKFFPLAEISSLNTAVTGLKNEKPIQCPNNGFVHTNWGYNVSKLSFRLNKFSPKKIKPNDASDLKLIIDVHLIGNCDYIGTLNDPLSWLVLDFRVEGEIIKEDKIIKIFTCYHLDRHIMKDGDGNNEPHPFYHFQFGGKKLLNSEGDLDTGDLIVIETPRIPHYPMDLIIGIDYLVSHFFPEKRKEILKASREYTILLKKYQDRILKPYFHTVSNHWNFNTADLVLTNPLWSPISICPQFIK